MPVQFLVPFEVDWRQHAISRVFAFWVVEEFDAVKDVTSGTVSCVACPTPDPFPFQQVEKAFGDGIVVAVPAAAHAAFQIVML